MSPAPPGPETGARLDVRLLVPALVAWAVLVVGLAHPPVLGVVGVGCLVLAATLARRDPNRRAGLILVLLVCAVVTLAGWAQHRFRTAGTVESLAAQRAAVRLEGIVSGDPRIVAADSERPAKRVFVQVTVDRVVGRGLESRVHTPVLVLAGGSADHWSRVRWWERVAFDGRLAPAEPGDDVVAVVTARGPPQVTGSAPAIARAAQHVRAGLRDAVAGLPPDAAGLVPAMVIGDRSLTPIELTDDMRATGMTHLCAVSGTNVTVVLTLTLRLCGLFRVRRRFRPYAAGLMLVGFVILARPEPSVLRAATMGAVGLLGLTSSRRGAGVPALAAAVVVLLCLDPWLARSYGFALSTLATLGLLVFVRPWSAWLRPRLPDRLGFLAEAVTIPVAAQAMCAPVVVLLQGSVSAIGVLANALAAPLVAPTTVVGVASAVLAPFAGSAASVVAWGAGVPALGIAAIAHGCAGVPFGTWPWPDGAGGALLLAGLTLGLLFTGPWLLGWARRHLIAAALLLGLGAAWLWPVEAGGWPAPGWRMVACDVGQGDALVLATGPDRAVLVDAGPDPGLVDACLARLGVRVLEAVVLTHFHDDHLLGLSGAVRGRRVEAVLTTPVTDPADGTERIRDLLARAGAPSSPLYAGDVLRWGEMEARVLWPARRIRQGSIPNNGSLALDVRAPGFRALLLADLERESAASVRTALARQDDAGPQPPVDVLKVAHHGSAKQDAELLRDTAAPVSVISVGRDNDYGHPAPSVLTLLAQTGSTVLRTDRSGDVLIGVQNGRLVVSRSRPD